MNNLTNKIIEVELENIESNKLITILYEILNDIDIHLEKENYPSAKLYINYYHELMNSVYYNLQKTHKKECDEISKHYLISWGKYLKLTNS